MTKKHDAPALNTLYIGGDEVDREVFAEQRSNLLLIAGDHYTKKMSKFSRQLRDAKDLTKEQKLRITKNHIQAIHKAYVNHTISAAPGVGFRPKNEAELQDQKSSEIHHGVWLDGKERYDIDAKNDEWVEDFFGVGEVATKIFWDPNAGDMVGFEQAISEDGTPECDYAGQPVAGDKAVFSGAFIFEDIYGFNLLRAPEAKTMRDSPYLIIRKMVDKDKLLKQYPDEEKQRFIKEGMDETYTIFDATKSSYVKAKNQVLVREFYFRSCPLYPEGYFYIATKEGILAEDVLPGGVFPIEFEACDRRQTTPRGVGLVKTMRPYQAEINRTASKIAEHQITLGDDKLLIQNGTKTTAGASLPGIRTVSYTGMKPEVVQGRSGSQYLEYMLSQIKELYQVMNVPEILEDTADKGGMDPYALLFRSAGQKKKFQRYVKRYERYLKRVAKLYLRLAKIYMPEDQIIRAVGKTEAINISEFKNMNDMDFEVIVEPQSDDIETKMGKQMAINHIIQYVGPQLGKDDIGKLIQEMPYSNMNNSFSDLTLSYENAKNDILALDRGQLPPLHAYDDHPYLIKKVTSRMRQADFQSLDPQIQNNFAQYIQAHEQAEVQRQQEIKQAEAEFIPTGGYLVACDLYIGQDAKDPSKVKRARIPYESLQWLLKQLESQGMGLQDLENMNQGAVAQMAGMSLGQQQNNGQVRPGVAHGQPGNSTGPGIDQSDIAGIQHGVAS